MMKPLTNETLTKERNLFLTCIFVVVGISLFLRVLALGARPDTLEALQDLGGILTLGAKAFFVYLVFRLSRFLRQPVWLTVMYCILTPFAVLYLVPFVGVLVGVKNMRQSLVSRASNTSAPSIEGGGP